MKTNIYIASSWKNHHAVDMLTDLLEKKGYTVRSFVRNSNEQQLKPDAIDDDFDNWCASDRGLIAFEYDTGWATKADLVIYISPSRVDAWAWAEVGAAWARANGPILGLSAKGEQVGLMRRMISKWYDDYRELLKDIESWCPIKEQTDEDL